jgi:hypothetical protein
VRFTYPQDHCRPPAIPTYRIRTELFLAETLSDEPGASGDVHQRHPYGDQDGDRHRQSQAVTLTSEDLTTLTGGTICAFDGVHTANIVILGNIRGPDSLRR